MISLARHGATLTRFERELAAQAPLPFPEQPDLAGQPTEDLRAARLAWASRIVDEHRSVVVFSELLGLLAELAAPLQALCAVQRLIGDEIRHVQLCAEVVAWCGGFAGLEIDLAGLGLPPRAPSESAAERAIAIVARELCVAETESVLVLRAYRDAATVPAVRVMFDILLRDEARHVAAGHALERLLRGHLPGSLFARMPAVMAADRAELRNAYLDSAQGGPGRALGASIERADLPYG